MLRHGSSLKCLLDTYASLFKSMDRWDIPFISDASKEKVPLKDLQRASLTELDWVSAWVEVTTPIKVGVDYSKIFVTTPYRKASMATRIISTP